MQSDFQRQYCSICQNKEWNPDSGLKCGLQVQPIIVNSSCPEFEAISSQLELQRFRAKEERRENRKERLKMYLSFGGSLMCIVLFLWYELWFDSDHRYTLAEVRVTSQSGLPKFLWMGGYTCDIDYAFKVNGKIFQSHGTIGGSRSGGLSEPIWPKKILVKYSVSNPTMNKVLYKADVSGLEFVNVPSNGIHPDSLEFYIE